MAIQHLCDGCGVALEGAPQPRGFVLKRDYCPGCMAIADEMQARLDAAHTALAASWKETLAALRDEYGRRLLALPDVEPQR